MNNKITAHGYVISSGSLVSIARSKGIASVIDNGVGSYQLVYDDELNPNYTLIVTPKETRDEGFVCACERNHFERSEMDFLVELKDKEGKPCDSDFNFVVLGD